MQAIHYVLLDQLLLRSTLIELFKTLVSEDILSIVLCGALDEYRVADWLDFCTMDLLVGLVPT